MFIVLQQSDFSANEPLLEQMFRLRKQVFHDRLGWNVAVQGPHERDLYDEMGPVYLMWTDDARSVLYGAIRLMPTTGPTLLYDVFRRTFPANVDLSAPGIWEGTRMCIDEGAIARDMPGLSPGDAFCRLLLALCEVALKHGIHTLVSNYEPHLKRLYQRAGAQFDEVGRADGYGRRPVCCGVFEVSPLVLEAMRASLAAPDAPSRARGRRVREAALRASNSTMGARA